MTVEEMREKITHVYAGPTWRCRVQGMDDRQVIAIYMHMVEDGIFDKIKKDSKRKKANTLHEEQLTIFDLLKEDKSESEEKQV